MNTELYFNDTLDNIYLSPNLEAVADKYCKNENNSRDSKEFPTKISNSKSTFSISPEEFTHGICEDISVDDSIFLSSTFYSSFNKKSETESTSSDDIFNDGINEECLQFIETENEVLSDKKSLAKTINLSDDNNESEGNNKSIEKNSRNITTFNNEEQQPLDEVYKSQNIISNIDFVNQSSKNNKICQCKYKSFIENETPIPSSSQKLEYIDVIESNKYLSYFHKEDLQSWGLPESILTKYKNKKILKMFSWQIECLNNKNVLLNKSNLVYSAPTSAGKTLVAEILLIKTVLESHKKVIFILPFVSVVREKTFYFQDLLGTTGIRVEGFMGSYNPPGGFHSVQIAICTIEKGNSLVNRMLEEGTLDKLGAVVVDEMHLVGDPSRGYLLELLLTKLLYMSQRNSDINIQIIGMSATLPNLDLLAKWLRAELYTTTFRPIPLYEKCYIGGEIYNNELKFERRLSALPGLETDTDNILQLCLETLKESCSVLIFCPTKNWCETLAQQISVAFWKLGSSKTELGQILRNQLNSQKIIELLEQLKRSPVGLDAILEKVVSFGVAFHHAGLTVDERDIIEVAFRKGTLRVLVATSTLSSGVNLPAKRVIIRTPIFHGKPIDTLSYRQMIGRAGRMGKDVSGESILICQKNDYKFAKELLSAHLEPVESCLNGAGKLKRALLEVIASSVVSTPEDIKLFADCTLLAVSEDNSEISNPIEDSVKFLLNNQFIRLQELEDGSLIYVATSLAKACLSSSMPPEEGLTLFTELEKARQCFVLETELHLIYLVTPYSACNQWGTIDWMLFLDMWEKLPASMKRVGELVGISESFIINASRGKIKTSTSKMYHKLQIHKRFFTALALQDLVNEIPLGRVASKFNCSRGMLQSLQQSASTFAGMVTAFSRKLGWSSVEILISQFQDRLQFGVNRDLLDLMRLPLLNGPRARSLYNAGIETLAQLATSDVCNVESILYTIAPFESEKEREGETKYEAERRNKIRGIWITGMEGLTEKDFAFILVQEARKYLQLEMGLKDVKWNVNESVNSTSFTKNSERELSIPITIKDNNINGTVNKNRYAIEKPANEDSRKNGSVLEKLHKTKKSPQHSTPVGNKSNERIILTPQKINKEASLSNESLELQLSASSSNENFFEYDNLYNKNEGGSLSNISSEDPFDNKNSFEKSSVVTSKKSIVSANDNKEKNSNDSGLEEFENISIIEKAFRNSINLNEHEQENDYKKINEEFETTNNMSDDLIANSQESYCVRFDVTANINQKKTKKMRSSEEFFQIQTPSKRTRIANPLKSEKYLKDENGCTTKFESIFPLPLYQSKNSERCTTLTQINVVNVCEDVNLFQQFYEDLIKQSAIAISVACTKTEEYKAMIGENVVKVNKNQINHETTKNNEFTFKNKKVVGVSIVWGDCNAYYISLDSNCVSADEKLIALQNVLGKESIRVCIFDSKEQIKVLKWCCNVNLYTSIDDPKVADWLLDSEGKEKSLRAMVLKYCPKAVNLLQLIGNCKDIGSIGLNLTTSIDAKIRSSLEAVLSWHLITPVLNALLDLNSRILATYNLEMDNMLCLAYMELNGIGVNTTKLQLLADNIKEHLLKLERQAFGLAGRRFSFTSSKEVAKVLGIHYTKRVNTNKQVLAQNQSPIANIIMQWRKLNCTLTKMIFPLIRMVQNGRIYSTCITHTATGRISMHEPNLQNIPRNFEIIDPITHTTVPINCRMAFEPSSGNVMLSADYCQLELRLLAHFSQDSILCSIMRTSEDIFRSIAAKTNNINQSEVTDVLRQQAKQICYGIIYGMGTKSLAEQLVVTNEEAIDFVEKFHKKYPGIKKYINETVTKCKELGYVETLGGRRRYLPNINHENPAIRSQAERQAVNTTIQGSAADIAKTALVFVQSNFGRKFSTTTPKLILQLHDEFLFEVQEDYLKNAAILLKYSMEKAAKLSIPFPVKLKAGYSWGAMNEFIV